MIETRFTLTEAEYIEAQRAYLEASGSGRQLKFFLIFILVVFVVAVATNPDPLTTLRDPRMLFPLLIVTIFLLSPWLQTRAFKKRFKVDAPTITNVHVLIDEEGYWAATSQGEGKSYWGGYSSYIETPRCFLLIKGFTFQVVSKQQLSETEVLELRELIARHLAVLTPKLAKTQGRR